MFDWLADLFDEHHDFDLDSSHFDQSDLPDMSDSQGQIGDHLNLDLDHHIDSIVNEPTHIQALYSLDRMTDNIEGFDLEQMKSFIEDKSFNENEFKGLISNWKGIYGEIKGIEELNSLVDGNIHYVIPEATNNPAVDIYGLDEDGNIADQIQVKMTNDKDYVQRALDDLPDGVRLMCPSEVAELFDDPRIIDAGFSHTELIEELSNTIEILNTPELWEGVLTSDFTNWLKTDFSYDPGLEG